VIGRRPDRIFVNADGTPKSQAMVALLIKNTLRKRAGIELTPHQFRHLGAKTILDDQPGAFETVRQLLGHKNSQTTSWFYSGMRTRRAGLHHQRLIEGEIAKRKLYRRGGKPKKNHPMERKGRIEMQGIYLRKQLPFAEWPQEIRRRWEAAFAKGNFLDDGGPAAHLQPTSRAALKSACGRFLRYLDLEGCEVDAEVPGKHINQKVLTAYVEYRRTSCSDRSIAIELHHLRLALRLIFPQVDWTWLLNATKRIARQAKPRRAKHHLVTSERLYLLGLELMDAAIDAAKAFGTVSKTCAFDYRDGLIIALVAVIPLRRRTLTALRLK